MILPSSPGRRETCWEFVAFHLHYIPVVSAFSGVQWALGHDGLGHEQRRGSTLHLLIKIDS